MATHRYNIENATAQLIVVSFNECECEHSQWIAEGGMIIKSIRIEKLAYQGEYRRLLLGGLPSGKHRA